MVPSCRMNKTAIVTFKLKHSDYIETIEVTGTLQAVNNNIVVTPRVYSGLKVATLAKEGTLVKKGDTICILAASDLMKTYEEFRTELEKMEGEKRSLEADNALQLSLLEARVETNNAQMEISMLDSIQLKFAPPVKQKLLALEMEKVKLEKKKLEKKLAAQKTIDNSELSQIGSRIAMQKNRLQESQGQINSLILVSPADGYVMHAETPKFYIYGGSTIGGKVEEGSNVFYSMPLFQIPDISKMQVSVEVPEADYKRINTDQKVEIRIESVTNLETTGKVITKSLASKPIDEKSSVKSYEVILSVDSCDLRIRPGLSATCKIIVDKVMDTIIVPSAAIFVKDSSKIVYVAEDGKFIPVQIETGLSNSSESVVSKGLKGNETIAMMEPPYSLIGRNLKSNDSVNSKSLLQVSDTLIKDSSKRQYSLKK